MDTDVRIRSRKLLLWTIVVLLVGAIAYLFGIEAIRSVSPATSEVSPETSVIVTEGRAIIMHDAHPINLHKEERHILIEGDSVRTLSESFATVFWMDGSITRLAPNTVINIREVRADPAKNLYRTSMTLERGRTWSNITSYLMKGSYFRQGLGSDDTVATVRGTIFEANIADHSIHAVNHEVHITSNSLGRETVVSEGNSIDFTTFSEKLQKVVDSAWALWNQQADMKYLESRMRSMKAFLSQSLSGTSQVHRSTSRSILSFFSKKDTVTYSDNPFVRETSQSIIDDDVDTIASLASRLDDALMKHTIDDTKRATIHDGLLALYERVHGFPDSDVRLRIKSILQSMIVATADDSEKTDFARDFARYDLYGTLTAVKSGYVDTARELTKQTKSYIDDHHLPSDYMTTFRDGLSRADASRYRDMLDSVLSASGAFFDSASGAVRLIDDTLSGSSRLIDSTSGMRQSINDTFHATLSGGQGTIDAVKSRTKDVIDQYFWH